MSKIKVIKENGEIRVKSPYSTSFVQGARKLSGKWNPDEKEWVFKDYLEEQVEALLLKAYDENTYGKRELSVIDLDITKLCNGETTYKGRLSVGGRLIALKERRDDPPYLPNNAIIISGGFERSYGSAKYPMLKWSEDTIIRIEFPKDLLDKLPDGAYTIIKETL